MKRLSNKVIDSKLKKAFDKHFGEYECSAEWYNNPSDNVWKFDIPELRKQILIICDEYTGGIEIKESYILRNGSIEREDLEYILIDALEVSIGHWALIHNDREEWIKYKNSDLTLGEKAVKILLDDNKSIKITEQIYHDEPKYELSLERLIEGINLNTEHRPWDADYENYDSITCDCIVQYAIFEDIIFS